MAALGAVMILLSAVAPARAEPLPGGLHLVMIDDPGCAYCRKWLAEVGPFYATSRQGQRAPLLRRRIGDAGLEGFGRLVYTPTFLLVRDGIELDRIVGYGGASEFWRQLQDILDKVDEAPAPPPRPAPVPALPSPERDARLAPRRLAQNPPYWTIDAAEKFLGWATLRAGSRL